MLLEEADKLLGTPALLEYFKLLLTGQKELANRYQKKKKMQPKKHQQAHT